MAFVESRNAGSLADTTPVVIVAAPAAGVRRLVRYISIYNADGLAILLTLYCDTGGVPSIIFKSNLNSGDTFVFGDGGETIVLNDTDQAIYAVLDGVVGSTQPDFVTTFAEVTP